MKYAILAMLGLMVAGCSTNKTRTNGETAGSSIPPGSGISVEENSTLPADGRRDLFPPVFFDYNSAQVRADQTTKCEEVALYLKKGKGKGVILEGHADERGSREYNLALGEVRCLAVRDYLISLGVNTALIHTKSYGEEQPADDGHDEAAWEQNRRVVFAIY